MQSILVTGCSSGIGRACSILLKRDGWNVYATARTPQDLEELGKLGLHAIHLDYTDTNSIHHAFDTVMEDTGGRLDAVFNNGAYGQPGAVEDLSTDVLRAQFEANFFGVHELTSLCLPIMRNQGHGRIINCSSVLGFVPAPWRGAYVASKYALEGLTSTLRLELANTGVHVSLIEPGPLATRFSESALQKFLDNIDIENSAYRKFYESELNRLKRQKASSVGRFTLPPEAIYPKLKHALNAKRPKAHYHVTAPTRFMGVAKRILPQNMIDKIIIKNT